MRADRSRRAVLAALGAIGLGGLAGCRDSTASARGATDVVLHNEVDDQRTVDVTVTAVGDDATIVDETVELAGNASRTINNRVVMGDDYDVRVAVDGAATDGSDYVETQRWTEAGQPLHALVNDQVVFAVQIG